MKTIEETYRERLKMLIAEYKTQAALAKAADINPAQISQWINASPEYRTGKPRSLKADTARKIEKATGKPAGWMDQPVSDSEPQYPSLVDVVSFDLYDIHAACGKGIVNSDFPDFIRRIDIPREHIYALFGTDNMHGIHIIGVDTDSMEPTIPRKSLVFIDAGVNFFDGDGIYAFVFEGETYIKRLQRMPGLIRAHSDNKKYDAFDITKDKMEYLHIIARFKYVMPLGIVDL